MKKLSLLIWVISAAAASAVLLNHSFWNDNRPALLVVLSVIAAGTLVRLARGLPFTTPDHYELKEIRELTAAVRDIMSKLRMLLVMIIGTMLLLVLAFPLASFVGRHLQTDGYLLTIFASAALGAMHAYVFGRMYQVVCSDEDLTRVQSRFIERAVERKQGKKFEGERSSTPISKTSTNYGKRIGDE